MAALTLAVPREYGYVLAVATASCVTSLWHGIRVSSFRRAAGIPYPQPYALRNLDEKYEHVGEKAKAEYLFNCAQRAHGNFVEQYPSFLAGLAISGLRYPIASASLGAAWIVARIFYATGYTNPNAEKGKGRLIGSLTSALFSLALFVLSGKTGYDLIQAA